MFGKKAVKRDVPGPARESASSSVSELESAASSMEWSRRGNQPQAAQQLWGRC